jgi:integrase
MAPATVQAFLDHLEQERGCSVATRNQRLSVMQSLALFLSMQGVDPEWCSGIRAIACKKVPAGQHAEYLETAELEALLRAPNPRSRFGLRDRTLLLLLYNTGARAADVARLKIGHLQWDPSPSVRIAGGGTQSPTCPLWPATVTLLRPLVADRSSTDPIFRCRNGKAMSRFGSYAAVVAHARRASRQQPSMAGKRISPHTLRNTARLHLARAGADGHGVQTTPGTFSGDERRIAGSA